MSTRGLWVAVLLLSSVPAGSAEQDGRQAAAARRLFVEVETSARLPPAQQAGRLERLYRDVCPQLTDMFVAHTVFGPAVPATAAESPGEAAERIERAGGWPLVADAGRRRCRELMLAQRGAVEALVRQDLREGSPKDRRWALHVIGELRAVRLFDDTIAALGGPEPIFAAQALRALDDPRAIAPLVRRYTDDPTHFYEILRSLQRNRPPHALLLELLRSRTETVRWQAAYALVESRDPVLVSVVPALVADPAADVRRQAGYIAVSFDDASYRLARASMLPLLSDADTGVRADIAVAVASRMDRASAPALLALMARDGTLEPWRHSNVVQAINTLTGTYFGLQPGTPSPAPIHSKALADFARWMKEHPPDSR